MNRWIGVTLALAAFATAAVAQQPKATWEDSVAYVARTGASASFYGPVAKSLGLGDGGSVNYKVVTKPGDPKRDFYVTDDAVVLSVTWKSGASRGYTATRAGVLRKAMARNRELPLAQAAGDFQTEKNWWIAAIAAEKAKTGAERGDPSAELLAETAGVSRAHDTQRNLDP